MGKELTTEEKFILEHICFENIKEYPNIIEHLDNIVVLSRKKTGVGIYLYFGYECDGVLPLCKCEDSFLSSRDLLYVKALESQLSYEVNLTNGYLDFLEIVSNDGDWDGVLKNVRFERDD